MLHILEYERRWERKLAWYREHDILPYEEDGGDAGTLIITRDSEKGAISSPEIERIIRERDSGVKSDDRGEHYRTKPPSD